PKLCGARGDRPSESAWRAFHLAWHAVLGPLRCGGPPAGPVAPPATEKRTGAFGPGSTIASSSEGCYPPGAAENQTAAWPTPPRWAGSLSGQITCQHRADRSLVNNTEVHPGSMPSARNRREDAWRSG